MKKSCKIAVIGSYMTDITAFTPRFPSDGETVTGLSVTMGPGGKGSNQATAASRSGAEVLMIAKTGSDAMAEVQRTHYKAENMDERHIIRTDRAATGTAFIEVNSVSGENRIIIAKGANELLSADEVWAAENEIAACDVVLTQLETELEAVKAAIDIAVKHNKPVILNPAPYRQLPKDFLSGVTWFTPNETEAEYYSGVKVDTVTAADTAAKALITQGVQNVIITLGKRGVFFSDGASSALIPPPDLKATDTTGAGDTFNGSFAVALSEGKNTEEALKFANCAAAISVTRKGASASSPLRKETDALMHKFYGI